MRTGTPLLVEERSRTTLIHVESGLDYVSLCGRSFAPSEVDRERLDPEEHSEFCFDCHTVANGGSVSESRRETISYLPGGR